MTPLASCSRVLASEEEHFPDPDAKEIITRRQQQTDILAMEAEAPSPSRPKPASWIRYLINDQNISLITRLTCYDTPPRLTGLCVRDVTPPLDPAGQDVLHAF
jgi:hypothetical protein